MWPWLISIGRRSNALTLGENEIDILLLCMSFIRMSASNLCVFASRSSTINEHLFDSLTVVLPLSDSNYHEMLFIYSVLNEIPLDSIKKSDGPFVIINFSFNVLKIIVEAITVFILLDIYTGGLIQDAALAEALITFLKLSSSVVFPLSIVVMSCMVWSEVLVPVNQTEDDDYF